MSEFSFAVDLIKKHEGFNESAYADLQTGKEPYTIGYGTQFYPDGSPVKANQKCSQKKAEEYLLHELKIIDRELKVLDIQVDTFMRQALLSFIHSIGWEPFLYSEIIDCIDNEDFEGVTEEMSRWVFDGEHRAIGGLIDRRRDEISLFLTGVSISSWSTTEILLTAFRNYTAAPHQVRAIRELEEKISPYVLSAFANTFCIQENVWDSFSQQELDSIFTSWV